MKKKMLVLFISLLVLSMSITNSVFASCGHKDGTITVDSLEFDRYDCTAAYMCHGATIYRITAQVCALPWCRVLRDYDVGSEHLCEDAGHEPYCPIGNYKYCLY